MTLRPLSSWIPVLVVALVATVGLTATSEPTLQQLPIFGAQAMPDPVGRGPGFPEIQVENVDACVANCGYLAEDGYSNPSRIDLVKSITQVEAETGTAATWGPAYLSGDHPWGTLCLTNGFSPATLNRCTNSWLNYRPNDESVPVNGRYASIRYRVRFYVPSFPRDENGNAVAATMRVKMKVDNWGKAWINGAPINTVIWASDSVDASELFAREVKEGLNTIELVVGDGGGLAGFTFLIELSMYADAPLGEVPADDPDSDGDGTPDSADVFPNDASETLDSDSDGVGNNADAFPNDPSETADSDGDGVGDNADVFPDDAAETRDSDGDGVGDNGDAFPLNPAEARDSDGDGVGDNSDAFPNDPSETLDSDGDGVGDNHDLYPNDPSASSNLTLAGVTTAIPARNGAQQILTIGEGACRTTSRNHGQYTSCVAKVLNGLKTQGLITGAEKELLQSIAAQSSIGKK